ncbi:unnamed protein product, partial [Musa hybrid cultivar]
MVRLVFRPYTQVRRTICTSVSLRASTRVSSGFASLRHSSPSFGSRHACSNSNPSQKIGSAGGATPREGSRPLASLCLPGFRTRRLARMSDSLVRVSRRVGWGAHWPMPRSHVCPAGHADGARHVLDRIDALDGIYRPIGAAFPNNPTRRQRLVVRQGPSRTGLSPSPAPLSRGLGPGPSLRTLLQTTIQTTQPPDSQAG